MCVGQLAEFADKHRIGKVFERSTFLDILGCFVQAMEDRTLTYTVDENGDITGVGHATRHDTDKVLYVHNVVTTRKGELKRMLRWFFKMFPDYSIEARRHDRLKRYNMNLLRRKVMS